MIARLLFAIAATAFLAGCVDTKPAPPVSELLHDKQLAQENAFLAYKEFNWKAAARNFEKTADILNAVDDYPGEAVTRHNQARALQHDGQFDAAITAYQRARDINHRIKHSADEAMNLAGLAQCYLAQGKLADAIKTAEQALPMATTNTPATKLILLNDLASFLLHRNQPGDSTRATEYLAAADPKAAITQINLGRAAFGAGQFAVAREHVERALEGFRAENNPTGIASAHEQLARCCAKLGKHEDATRHLEQARQKYTFLKNAAAVERLKSFQP